MHSLPHVHTLRPLPELDYCYSRSMILPVALSPLEAWNLMTESLGPMLSLAFRLRDAISAHFGVRPIGGFSGPRKDAAQPGDRLDFFLVEHNSPQALVLTERDRHLDVMNCLSITDRVLTLTTSVVTHNAFGRAYMLPVGPVHKLIVAAGFRSLNRRLKSTAPVDTP